MPRAVEVVQALFARPGVAGFAYVGAVEVESRPLQVHAAPRVVAVSADCRGAPEFGAREAPQLGVSGADVEALAGECERLQRPQIQLVGDNPLEDLDHDFDGQF